MRVLICVAAVVLTTVRWGVCADEVYDLGHSSDPRNFVAVGSRAVFHATTIADGDEIWTTDGTSATRVTSFPASTIAGPAFGHQGKAFFLAANESVELHEVDGTTARLVTALNVPVGRIRDAKSAGNFFAFAVYRDSPRQLELWRSDGTTAGTLLLSTIANAESAILEPAGGRMFFSVQRNPLGTSFDLIASDGTIAGTTTVVPSSSSWVRPFGDRVLALGAGGLWISDGTTAGTRKIAADAGSVTFSVGVVDAHAYYNGPGGLWKTDGTSEGTALLKPVPEGDEIQVVAPLSGDRVVFTSQNATRVQFWISDGTTAGTSMYKEMPHIIPPNALGYLSTGDQVFFTMRQADVHGQELWRTDGTSGGTYRVKDIARWLGYSYARWMTSFNGKLLFAANDAVHGFEPWISDGTENGTSLLGNLDPEGIVRGRVIDQETGVPLPDAEVAVYLAPYGAPIYFDVDPDGFYSIEGLRKGQWNLFTSIDDGHINQCWPGGEIFTQLNGCEPIPVSAPIEYPGYEFTLRQGARISGRVTNSAGEGIRSRIELRATQGSSPVRTIGTTGDGQFPLATIPPGSWIIRLDSDDNRYYDMIYPDVRCSPSCEMTPATPVVFAPGDALTLDVTVPRKGRIQGRLTSTTPGSTLNVQLQLEGPGGSSGIPVINDTFDATLLDGPYRLFVQASGEHESTWYSTLGCRPCTKEQATFISAAPDSVTSGYDIVVPYRGSTINGRITDAVSGKALSGITVVARQANGVEEESISNANGEYSLKVVAGTYAVYTRPRARYASTTYDGDLAIGEGATTSGIDLRLAVDSDGTLGRIH